MRAAAINEIGDPSGVGVREVDDPEAGPGEAVVRVEACSLNHRDLKRLHGGGLTEADLPQVMGSDVAGTVEALGPGVDAVDVGDRVVLCPNLTCGVCDLCREGPENQCREYSIFVGGFAERAAVEARRLVSLPDGIDAVTASALPIVFMTAWHMLRRAGIGPGDRLFVAGATGGVGLAAVQLADMLGARTIGTSTSADKLDRARDHGLHHGIESGDPDEIEAVVDELGPVDVVVNHLSGEYTALGLAVLDRGGRLVTCGQTAGDRSEIDMRDLYWQHKRLIGSTMGTQADLERIVDLVAAGAVAPAIGSTYPLDEAADAFARLEDRSAFGKQVVLPND